MDILKDRFVWALIAGVVIDFNGVLQLIDGNMVLGIASMVVGSGAILIGILKPGKGK